MDDKMYQKPPPETLLCFEEFIAFSNRPSRQIEDDNLGSEILKQLPNFYNFRNYGYHTSNSSKILHLPYIVFKLHKKWPGDIMDIQD